MNISNVKTVSFGNTNQIANENEKEIQKLQEFYVIKQTEMQDSFKKQDNFGALSAINDMFVKTKESSVISDDNKAMNISNLANKTMQVAFGLFNKSLSMAYDAVNLAKNPNIKDKLSMTEDKLVYTVIGTKVGLDALKGANGLDALRNKVDKLYLAKELEGLTKEYKPVGFKLKNLKPIPKKAISEEHQNMSIGELEDVVEKERLLKKLETLQGPTTVVKGFNK